MKMTYFAFLRLLILYIAFILNLMLITSQITYKIDDTRLGRLFEGIGGISGGGVFYIFPLLPIKLY